MILASITKIFFAFVLAAILISSTMLGSYASTSKLSASQPINGVAMKGAFVNMKQHVENWPLAPQNYIEDRLKDDFWRRFESCQVRVLLGSL